MKVYKSFLAEKLEKFIVYRENLGIRNRNSQAFLVVFDQYVIEQKADWPDFTPRFFLEFQGTISGSNRTVNLKLAVVHVFFTFLVREGTLNENPLQDIPSRPENRFIPFLFAPDEITQLLNQVQQTIRKKENRFFRDYTVYMAFLLLARCGMRLSEPLGMTIDSYRKPEGTLYIKKTKFYKDRLIPLPLAVLSELDNYLPLRRKCCKENQYLLPGIFKNKGLSFHYIYPCFHQVLKDTGLAQSKHVIGTTTFGAPTIHSLRHSFAVNTLSGMKQRGDDPQQGLPVLAAYMGHRKYRYTALYLKMLNADQRNNLVDFTLSHQEMYEPY
jgi:integrase